MAIAFRSKGAWVAGTTSISMTMPTTHVAGDLLLMFIHTCNNAITTAPGNGWQLLSPSPVSTGTANTALGVRLTVYWKIAASSSEAAQTVGVTSGTATNGLTMAFSGVDPTTPFDVTPVSAIQASSLANLSFPTLTTATNGAMIVNAVGLDNDTASSTIVTSPTNASLTGVTRQHGQTVSTSTGGGVCVITGAKTSAGLISATTATVAAAARAYLTIALRPIDIRSGTTSITNAGSVNTTIQKGGQSESDISNASSAVVQGIKKALGIVSISQPSTVTTTGQRQVETHSGSTSISQASTVTISAKKTGKGLSAISQPSTVSGLGVKKAAGSVSIEQPSTIVSNGKKTGKVATSISNPGTMMLSGKKQAKASLQISQPSTVTSLGIKVSKVITQISSATSVIVTGVKSAAFESKFGQTLINQASTVTILGIKKSVGISTISQGSNLTSNGRKGARSTLGITQNTGISTIGRKSAKGSSNIVSGVSVATNAVKIAYAVISISVESIINVTGKRVTSTIVAEIRRGTSALVGIVHGRAAVDHRSSSTSATSRKSTGIFRINNKKKGTVNMHD